MNEPTSFKISTLASCYFFPSMLNEPLVGFVIPKNIFIVVDFPAPFGPVSYTHLIAVCVGSFAFVRTRLVIAAIMTVGLYLLPVSLEMISTCLLYTSRCV